MRQVGDYMVIRLVSLGLNAEMTQCDLRRNQALSRTPKLSVLQKGVAPLFELLGSEPKIPLF